MQKSLKLVNLQPLLQSCEGLVVVLYRGCGVIRGSKLSIFDQESRLRWYFEGSGILPDFEKLLND